VKIPFGEQQVSTMNCWKMFNRKKYWLGINEIQCLIMKNNKLEFQCCTSTHLWGDSRKVY